MTEFGRLRVIAPVAPDTAIWLAVPASEVTPVLVMVTAPVAPLTLMPVPATLEVTPVLVMTPVAETYEMPVPPEREVEEILLLNVLKSVEERKPLAPVPDWVMVTFPAAKTSGAEYVVVATN